MRRIIHEATTTDSKPATVVEMRKVEKRAIQPKTTSTVPKVARLENVPARDPRIDVGGMFFFNIYVVYITIHQITQF